MAYTAQELAIDNRVGAMQGSLINLFAEYNPIWRMIPQVTTDGPYYEYERVVSLPSGSWRGFNESYAESTGVTNPFREYSKTFGQEAKADVALLRRQGKNAPAFFKRQIMLAMMSASNEYTRVFLEGTELNNIHEPVGLRSRCAGDQLIENASGGGALTLAKLNSLVDAVTFSTSQEEGMRRGQGIRKVLLMNRTHRAKIDALIGAQTGSLRVNVEKDAFGKYVERWRDADIVIIENHAGTTILGFDEDPGDGVSDCSSIYCVAFAEELAHGFRPRGNGTDILMTQQFGGPLGMESEPRKMVRFEGDFGFAYDDPKCAARLHAITNA